MVFGVILTPPGIAITSSIFNRFSKTLLIIKIYFISKLLVGWIFEFQSAASVVGLWTWPYRPFYGFCQIGTPDNLFQISTEWIDFLHEVFWLYRLQNGWILEFRPTASVAGLWTSPYRPFHRFCKIYAPDNLPQISTEWIDFSHEISWLYRLQTGRMDFGISTYSVCGRPLNLTLPTILRVLPNLRSWQLTSNLKRINWFFAWSILTIWTTNWSDGFWNFGLQRPRQHLELASTRHCTVFRSFYTKLRSWQLALILNQIAWFFAWTILII
jgi:hypothetical protein